MPPKLGILAGSGLLPQRIIEACRESGRGFFVIAFKGQTDPRTIAPGSGEDIPHSWVRLGAAGKAVDELRRAGVEEIVMAGAIRRPSLASLRPDKWAARFFARTGVAALGDDSLLTAIVKVLEKEEGFRVVGPENLIPGLLAPEGVLGNVRPDELALADVEQGILAARGVGALDIGQAAVVHQGMVLAVEAADGTDAMLAHVRDMHRDSPGGVLVKMKKPDQESRADLPAIGVSTITAVSAAGLGGIAVEAGGALVVDLEAVVAAADDAGLFVIGVPAPEER